MKNITLPALILFAMIPLSSFSDNDSTGIFNVYKGDALEICEGFKAGATSTLPGPKKNPNMYEPNNVIDGDLKTIWSEGASGPGIGEELIFDIPSDNMPHGPRNILIMNGNALSKKMYYENNRIKDLTVIIFVGVDSGVYENYCTKYIYREYKRFDYRLADKIEYQKIALNIDYNESKLFWRRTREELRAMGRSVFDGEYGQYVFCSLKIKSVYKGSKYDDTCVTEISFE